MATPAMAPISPLSKQTVYRSALEKPRPSALPPWMKNPEETWLTVPQFAKIMRRSQSAIYKWIETGTLDAFRISKYRDPGGRWWIKFDVE